MEKISKVLTLDKLDTAGLEALFSDQVCAVCVPHFASTSLCDMLSHWFLNHDQIEEYHHEVRTENGINYLKYGVERVGVAFNTTYDKSSDSPETERYYREALPGVQNLRQACSPYLSPIDALRLQFDELWPYGANVAAFEGKKMFTGIGRVMDAATSHLLEEQPHFDSVPEKLSKLIGQFSANIYLTVPSSGGELELWDMPPLPIAEIDNADLDTDWRSHLGESLLIKPEKGELVLINTRRAHAVRRFNEGKRISLQSFIGLKADNSLALWV